MSKRTQGFTLIELMVAVAILALLSAIALPVYTRYSDRTYRSEAMADLLDCSQALERRASVTFDYLGAGVGGADDNADVDPAICPTLSPRYTYEIDGTAATFVLTATPDAGIDDDRVLTLNSNGQRTWDGNPGWEE